jgi:meiotically up-regulated gene 157 (Mug157) protein
MVENMTYLEPNTPPRLLVCMSSCKQKMYILYLIIDLCDFISLCRCWFLWSNALFHLILSQDFNLISFTIEQ